MNGRLTEREQKAVGLPWSPELVERAFRPLARLGARGVPVFVVPGNHDLSNAIGYPRPLTPARDATAAAAAVKASSFLISAKLMSA